MKSVKLINGENTAEVSLFGGMTTAKFLVDGKVISPFYQNTWGLKPEANPFMANLKGDFFCLPFGIPPSQQLPDGWDVECADFQTALYPHGYSANGSYEIKILTDTEVTLSLPYQDGFVDRVERTVTLEKNGLSFVDTVFAKKEFSAPVGIHPIFKLPESAKAALLQVPACKELITYPIAVDESSVFEKNASVTDMKRVPLQDGGYLNATALPFDIDTEELLFAADVSAGECMLVNTVEKYSVTLSWNKDMFPNCMFWFSNRGRKAEPWNGRNLCLGIEPVASAFDLGTNISNSPNPMMKKGIYTTFRFTPDKPIRFEHCISVKSL